VSDALVGLEDIRAAAERIRGVALRTPLVPFTAGPPPVLLKAESLQPIGAFKIRGAWNAIAQLTEAERRRGVVTHSSGNHAQGVARAARLAGIRAVVVMPADAPAVKRARVEADGAEIVTVAVESGAREAMADRLIAERGLVLVPPYDDDRIIAGQGTVGLEIVVAPAALVEGVLGGGLADGARPEPCAAQVRGAFVVGDAQDRRMGSRGVLGIVEGDLGEGGDPREGEAHGRPAAARATRTRPVSPGRTPSHTSMWPISSIMVRAAPAGARIG